MNTPNAIEPQTKAVNRSDSQNPSNAIHFPLGLPGFEAVKNYRLLSLNNGETLTPAQSRTFRKLLAWISDETCPKLAVYRATNGTLLTKEEWAKFPKLRGKVKRVWVSVDGASKETHEFLRRGSRWEVMKQNLPFIGGLLAKGEIAGFALNFVVQKENFHEMGAVVELAREVGADSVSFDRITNWGTFSAQAYEEKAVFASNHPRHQEFLLAMADIRLREPKVTLGRLTEFLPKK
jgi:MoaA/NifB/PqqE/SkfB family radical SAM enzyme